MFRRIMVANRGEVAARVLRTAKSLGIEVVLICSDADSDLRFLQQADVVENLGSPRCYLDQDAILCAARKHRCAAIHPGWGFLAENPTFAARCEAARITFIGPSSASMRTMADKAEARQTMAALGLDPIPGSDGPLESVKEARACADQMGFPVLLKAVSGGGGKGMRRVAKADDLEAAFNEATAEASSAFADGRLYLEKLIERGRHIEIQVMGDGELVVALRERECSVQRRHQKLIEESPSPALSRDVADEIGARVAQACTRLGYRGAGTIEMLMDPDDRLWFMEMNTRLQVEHTVTEALSGLDLVALQLQVAANQRVRIDPTFEGHALECRINAEDPSQGFAPTPGTLTRFRPPQGQGIRVDTHLVEQDDISPHYDSMIAKVITIGETRDDAIERMKVALNSFEISGVTTTIPLHLQVLDAARFRSGNYDTHFLEEMLG